MENFEMLVGSFIFTLILSSTGLFIYGTDAKLIEFVYDIAGVSAIFVTIWICIYLVRTYKIVRK